MGEPMDGQIADGVGDPDPETESELLPPEPAAEPEAVLSLPEPEPEPELQPPDEPTPEPVELTGHLLLEREAAEARARRDQLIATRDHYAKTKNYRDLGQAKKDLEVAEVELALKEDEFAAALAEWEAREVERMEQMRQDFLNDMAETGLLETLDEYYQKDQEIVLAAVVVRGAALEFASAELRGSGRVVRAAVKQDGLALQFASESMRNDKEICDFAVNQCGLALQYVTEQVQNRKGIVLSAVTQDGYALRFASARLQEDEDVVLAAVAHSGTALRYAGEVRQDDREVVLAAVAQCGLALEFASGELINDPEVVTLAVRGRGHALRFASPEMRNDRNVVMDALALDENDVDEFVGGDERDVAEFGDDTRDGLRMVVVADETTASMVQLLADADNSEAVPVDDMLTAPADVELSESVADVPFDAEDTETNVTGNEVRPASGTAIVADHVEDPVPEIDDAIPSVDSPLAYASLELRDDAEVVLRAIARLPAALTLASDDLKNDRVVAEAAVVVEGGLLQYASERLKRDTRLVIVALQTDLVALEYASADVVKELAALVTPEEIDHEAEEMEKRKPKLELMMTEKLMLKGEDDTVLRMDKYSKELLRITSGVEVSSDETDEEAEEEPLLTPQTEGAVTAAVRRLYGCLDRAPPDVLLDRLFIFGAVRDVGATAFKHASDVLRGDIELIQKTCDKIARDNTPLDALSEVIRQKRQEAYDEVIKYVTPEGKILYDAELQRLAEEKEKRLRALDSEVDVYLERRREAREKQLREEKLARIAAGGSESDSQAEDSDSSSEEEEEPPMDGEDAASAALRKELEGVAFGLLKKRADTLGVDQKAVLDCAEEAKPEQAISDLIVDADAALRMVKPPTPPPTPPVEHHHFAGLLAGRTYVPGHEDGSGRGSTFNAPSSLLIDERHDIIYLTDNNSVRRLTLRPDPLTQETDGTAEVETLAGGGNAGCKDGFGCLARFRQPSGLVLKMDGGLVMSTDQRDHNHSSVLLICDSWNHRIRELNLLTQKVRTVAGNGQCADVDGAALVKDNAGAVANQWLIARKQRMESKPKSPLKPKSPEKKQKNDNATQRQGKKGKDGKPGSKSAKSSNASSGDEQKAGSKKKKKVTKKKAAGTKKKKKAEEMTEDEAAVKIQSAIRGRSGRRASKKKAKAKREAELAAAKDDSDTDDDNDSDDENRKPAEVQSEEDADSEEDEDAMATACSLCRPTAAVMGTDGTVYISCIGDENGNGHTIRMLSPKMRRLRTLAGRAGVPGYVDGPASGALFDDPHGLAFLEGHDKKTATLFVADRGNHVIRRLLLRTRGPHAQGGARRASPSTTLVDTVLISPAPRKGILPPKPPVDLDELERKGGAQPRKEKTENDRLWFVRPTQVSVSGDDGTLYVADEGGHGKRATAAGAGRARLQRLARRGTLYYNPITREYAEAPNDYVISVVHTPSALQHGTGLALRHGKSLRGSAAALEDYEHNRHPGDKGSAWFIADGETHTVHTGPCSRHKD
jgi:hypothetical protein